jgi:hypothetical protein
VRCSGSSGLSSCHFPETLIHEVRISFSGWDSLCIIAYGGGSVVVWLMEVCHGFLSTQVPSLEVLSGFYLGNVMLMDLGPQTGAMTNPDQQPLVSMKQVGFFCQYSIFYIMRGQMIGLL